MIPGLIAHLWQSTLFAGVAWLLALALRRNEAQVRYRVLFIASIKFLIPFSLLVGLGTLAPRHDGSAGSNRDGWMRTTEPLITLPAVATQVAAVGARTVPNYFGAVALLCGPAGSRQLASSGWFAGSVFIHCGKRRRP